MEGSGDRPSERGKGSKSNRHATPCHAELLMATTNVSTLSYSRPRPSRPSRLPRPISRPIQVRASCSLWTSGGVRFYRRARLRNPKLTIYSVMHIRALVRDSASKMCNRSGEIGQHGMPRAELQSEDTAYFRISIPKFEVQSSRASLTDATS